MYIKKIAFENDVVTLCCGFHCYFKWISYTRLTQRNWVLYGFSVANFFFVYTRIFLCIHVFCIEVFEMGKPKKHYTNKRSKAAKQREREKAARHPSLDQLEHSK